MPALDQLVASLRTVAPTVTAVAIVGLFCTMAYLLWAWRKMALRD